MKTEHIVLGGLLAGATYLAFDKKALNKTKKAVGLSDKGSSKRRVKIKGTDFKRVTSDVYGNPRYVIHYVNLKPDGEYGTKYEDILALNKKLSLGGRKYHNKQYGGGLVFQSYNIEDTAKELTKDLNAYYNSSTNGLSDKGKRKRTRTSNVWTVKQEKAFDKLNQDFQKLREKKGIEEYSYESSELWRTGGFKTKMRKIFGKD